MSNKPVCKTCGLEVDEHFITLDNDGRAVAGRYGPGGTEWTCYSEIEIEKGAINRERERILALIDASIRLWGRDTNPEYGEAAMMSLKVLRRDIVKDKEE
jgi:hypothetical protein